MITSVCLLLSAATLSIHPNRLQFFWYDTITLSCGLAGNSGNWTVKRNTSSQLFEPCSSGWGMPNETSCTIEDTYPSDTGVYWCESEQGEFSNSLNIIVTAGVILSSPALPVTEGEKVTLQCYYKEDDDSSSTLNFSANFYKDGVFIGTQPVGYMTLETTSTNDEGFYKCEYPGKGESPQVWMAVKSIVRAPPPTPPLMSLPRLVCTVLLIILFIVLSIVCVKVHTLWAKARAEAKRVSYHLSQLE